MDEALKLKAEQLAGDIAAQTQTLDDLNGLIRTLLKSALERMLDTELDVHLGRQTVATLPSTENTDLAPPAPANRRNGHSQKTVRGELGELTLDTPRDRNGTFEPQLIAKHQRRLTGFDEKIRALYAKGMTTRDIQDVVKELYGVDVSPTLVSEITADLDAEVTAWRQRRLDAVWPIAYLDGIVVHGVPGDPRGVAAVDDADRGLEGGAEPLRHHVRGPTATEQHQLTTSPLSSPPTQKNLQARHAGGQTRQRIPFRLSL
jgi:putative transposase